MRHITIVVPVLNEALNIDSLLDQLMPLAGAECRIVLVDGGSQDNTVSKIQARGAGDLLVVSSSGRASQLAAGVAVEAREILWFLHADTKICPGALDLIREALRGEGVWGRFDVRLSGSRWAFRIIESAINIRSRYTGICTGDQGMFMSVEALSAIGGVPMQALMEDVEMAKRLKKISPPVCLHQALVTSSRKWEKNGVLRTILLMFWLRCCYFFGMSPDYLHRLYYRSKQKSDEHPGS